MEHPYISKCIFTLCVNYSHNKAGCADWRSPLYCGRILLADNYFPVSDEVDSGGQRAETERVFFGDV